LLLIRAEKSSHAYFWSAVAHRSIAIAKNGPASLSLIDSADGSDRLNTIWTEVSIDQMASDRTTRLEFLEAGNPNSDGMFLDAVSVQLNNG